MNVKRCSASHTCDRCAQRPFHTARSDVILGDCCRLLLD